METKMNNQEYKTTSNDCKKARELNNQLYELNFNAYLGLTKDRKKLEGIDKLIEESIQRGGPRLDNLKEAGLEIKQKLEMNRVLTRLLSNYLYHLIDTGLEIVDKQYRSTQK